MSYRVPRTIPTSILYPPAPNPPPFLVYRASPRRALAHCGSYFLSRCNQQIAASALLVKMPDVVRSTVQKAVVVLASKPIFGPIRYALRHSSIKRGLPYVQRQTWRRNDRAFQPARLHGLEHPRRLWRVTGSFDTKSNDRERAADGD